MFVRTGRGCGGSKQRWKEGISLFSAKPFFSRSYSFDNSEISPRKATSGRRLFFNIDNNRPWNLRKKVGDTSSGGGEGSSSRDGDEPEKFPGIDTVSSIDLVNTKDEDIRNLLDMFKLREGDEAHKSQLFRDHTLESRVIGLLKQTMELAKKKPSSMHPRDREAQEKAKDAQERLTFYLMEMQRTDPDGFNDIVEAMKRDERHKRMEKDKKSLQEGDIPGTLTPPWSQQNDTWQSFFHSIQEQQEADEFDEDDPPEPELTPQEKELKRRYPWLETDPAPAREALTRPSPAALETKKRQCIFCSKDRHLYPLEPLNVPLLLKFMTPSGTIRNRRTSGMCRRMHLRVAKTIKQARAMGLFHYRNSDFTVHYPLDYGEKPKGLDAAKENPFGDEEDVNVTLSEEDKQMYKEYGLKTDEGYEEEEEDDVIPSY